MPAMTEIISDLSKRVGALETKGMSDNEAIFNITKIYGTIKVISKVRILIDQYYTCSDDLFCSDDLIISQQEEIVFGSINTEGGGNVIHINTIDRLIQFLNEDVTHIGLSLQEANNTDELFPADAEVLRKQCTNMIIDTGVLTSDIYLDETEGNGNTYQAIGIFGNGATDTVDTGELVASDAVELTKDATQSLTISVELQIVDGGAY